MSIRQFGKADREKVIALVHRTNVFSEEEIEVAGELLDIVINEPNQSDYIVYVSCEESVITGYFCIGQTPLTDGTYDLYWIAVDPDYQGKGIGKCLLEYAEGLVKAGGGRLIVAETSSMEKYRSTRLFYQRSGYAEVTRIKDYYREGDDLVIYGKYL
ncbi:MAG: GNAT family N-acetyltransferase [Bacteroidota bacterium]